MRWLRALWWWRRRDRDLARELAAHIDIHAEGLMASGLPRAEARRRAIAELGGLDHVTEQVRDARTGVAVEQCFKDLVEAARALRRTPGVTLTAIGLIALVAGGNTTIYSMVHAVLTRPAPGVHADRLVALEIRADGVSAGNIHSYPDFEDYLAQTRSLAPLLAWQFQRFIVEIDRASYSVPGGLVSSNYLETLGATLVRGRTFTSADQTSPALVAIISDRLVQEDFSARDEVIGQAIRLNGHVATIVGVAAPEFSGATIGEAGGVWVPLRAYHRLNGTEPRMTDRGELDVMVIGRLTPDATMAGAGAEFATISSRLQAAYPLTNRERSVIVRPYSMSAGAQTLLAEQAPRLLGVLFIVTVLTVGIVCANVANLMLARAAVRQRELALRQTLGASRTRILRLLMAEGAIIATVSWAAAYLFALTVSRAVVRLVPQDSRSALLLLDLSPDWEVVAYAFAMAIAGMAAVTLAPAMRAWRLQPLRSLRSAESGVIPGRSRLSTGLVVLQLAFAVLLLTSAGLAYRSMSMLESMDAGFRKDHLVLVSVETGQAAVSDRPPLSFLDRLRDRLLAVPGIEGVSYSWPDWNRVEARTAPSGPILRPTLMTIGDGFFGVLGMPLLAGREFAHGEPRRNPQPVIVTEHLAERAWPGQSPIGRTLYLGSNGDIAEVVGLVPDGVFSRFQRETHASYVFRPLGHVTVEPAQQYYRFEIRHSGALATVAPAIRQAVGDVDARVPIDRMRTMEDELAELASAVAAVTIWITLFATGALVIATIGQYAVVAFDMRRRSRDFAVRIALGAAPRQILQIVFGQGFRWTALGLGIGFGLSVAAGRMLQALLVGITPTDLVTYISVFSILATASLLACCVPAWRAATLDPIATLRDE